MANWYSTQLCPSYRACYTIHAPSHGMASCLDPAKLLINFCHAVLNYKRASEPSIKTWLGHPKTKSIYNDLSDLLGNSGRRGNRRKEPLATWVKKTQGLDLAKVTAGKEKITEVGLYMQITRVPQMKPRLQVWVRTLCRSTLKKRQTGRRLGLQLIIFTFSWKVLYMQCQELRSLFNHTGLKDRWKLEEIYISNGRR